MKHLDRQVIDQALEWLGTGAPIWLCTVLSTYGSAPREPGSMLVATASGLSVGSLSGGCVEDDFLERLQAGRFDAGAEVIRYGEGGLAPTLALPCGGVLDVLVERITPSESSIEHFNALAAALGGQRCWVRQVSVPSGLHTLIDDQSTQSRVFVQDESIQIRVGPSRRLLVAGLSPVAGHCIDLGLMLGYEVVVCDPRGELLSDAQNRWPQVQWVPQLPARFIESGGCHRATAVVALTHDPRIDDLTMMEAVRSEAFYIGAMGSRRTSEKRRERLSRIGGLSPTVLQRISAPIGLALGSKTPAEIALAVMADVVRTANGVCREAV